MSGRFHTVCDRVEPYIHTFCNNGSVQWLVNQMQDMGRNMDSMEFNKISN